MYALKCALLCAAFVAFSLFIGFNTYRTDYLNAAGMAGVSVDSASPEQNDSTVQPSETDRHTIAERYGKLPMHFEPNVGQTDASVKFLARGHGYSLFLTGTEAVLALRQQAG